MNLSKSKVEQALEERIERLEKSLVRFTKQMVDMTKGYKVIIDTHNEISESIEKFKEDIK